MAIGLRDCVNTNAGVCGCTLPCTGPAAASIGGHVTPRQRRRTPPLCSLLERERPSLPGALPGSSATSHSMAEVL
eukprot:2779051-Amphidinium_carterae.1